MVFQSESKVSQDIKKIFQFSDKFYILCFYAVCPSSTFPPPLQNKTNASISTTDQHYQIHTHKDKYLE